VPRADATPADAPSQSALGEHVRLQASLEAASGEDDVATLRVVLRFDQGWHGYAPSSAAGFPLRLALEHAAGLEPEGELVAPPPSSTQRTADGVEEWLTGSVTFTQRYRMAGSEADPSVRVGVGLIVCDQRRCLPPQQLELVVALPAR
jgi:hypothetical protein